MLGLIAIGGGGGGGGGGAGWVGGGPGDVGGGGRPWGILRDSSRGLAIVALSDNLRKPPHFCSGGCPWKADTGSGRTDATKSLWAERRDGGLIVRAHRSSSHCGMRQDADAGIALVFGVKTAERAGIA